MWGPGAVGPQRSSPRRRLRQLSADGPASRGCERTLETQDDLASAARKLSLCFPIVAATLERYPVRGRWEAACAGEVGEAREHVEAADNVIACFEDIDGRDEPKLVRTEWPLIGALRKTTHVCRSSRARSEKWRRTQQGGPWQRPRPGSVRLPHVLLSGISRRSIGRILFHVARPFTMQPLTGRRPCCTPGRLASPPVVGTRRGTLRGPGLPQRLLA